jgi:hypothetical protein
MICLENKISFIELIARIEMAAIMGNEWFLFFINALINTEKA